MWEVIASTVLFIRIGDTWESRLLVAELTRDWTITAEGRKFGLERYNCIVRSLNVKFIVDHGMLDSERPSWCFNRYGRYTLYPKRAFRMSTYPLLYTQWVFLWHRWASSSYEWKQFRYYSPRAFESRPIKPKKPWQRPGVRKKRSR